MAMATTTTSTMATTNNLDPSPSNQKTLRNPLPLSASQEAQVKDIYYRRVRNKCAAEIKEFADCARGRTVTATWLCRAPRLAMNGCMVAHATAAEEDAAREEWFAGVEERRRRREEEAREVERRRVEVREVMRRAEEKREREEMGKKGKEKGWWG